MPAPRLSQAAELENANAAQAFNEKKWVWVPDEKEGYLSGWVNSEDGEVAEVVLPDANEVSSRSSYCSLSVNNSPDPSRWIGHAQQDEPPKV